MVNAVLQDPDYILKLLEIASQKTLKSLNTILSEITHVIYTFNHLLHQKVKLFSFAVPEKLGAGVAAGDILLSTLNLAE